MIQSKEIDSKHNAFVFLKRRLLGANDDLDVGKRISIMKSNQSISFQFPSIEDSQSMNKLFIFEKYYYKRWLTTPTMAVVDNFDKRTEAKIQNSKNSRRCRTYQ